MKKQKILKVISNIAFGIGIALFAYYIFDFISSRAGLPADVCPFDNSRPFAMASVCFLVLSLVLSFFEKRKLKNRMKQKKQRVKTKKKNKISDSSIFL
jgi:hypothetical protein